MGSDATPKECWKIAMNQISVIEYRVSSIYIVKISFTDKNINI